MSARPSTGRLPNAINIYLPDIRGGNAQLQEAKKIVVYGADWTDPLPIAGAKRLLVFGYQNVYQYRGGVEEWREKGHPVHSDDGDVRPEADQ
jgi:rhodanese-related sulfurtransferase